MLQELWHKGRNIGSDENPLERGHLSSLSEFEVLSFKL
jgi:hypothetical protein